MNEALWVRLIGRGENHLALSQDGLGLTEVQHGRCQSPDPIPERRCASLYQGKNS